MARWRGGNVPLPEPHLVGLFAGIVLHLFFEWRLLRSAALGHAIGWPLVLGGCGLAVWAVVAAGTVNLAHSDRVVTGGPFRLSRHPMYVAWTLIYLGVTLAVNTAWPLALLPGVLVWMHVVAVREERSLEARFGPEYRRYASRTRRYV